MDWATEYIKTALHPLLGAGIGAALGAAPGLITRNPGLAVAGGGLGMAGGALAGHLTTPRAAERIVSDLPDADREAVQQALDASSPSRWRGLTASAAGGLVGGVLGAAGPAPLRGALAGADGVTAVLQGGDPMVQYLSEYMVNPPRTLREHAQMSAGLRYSMGSVGTPMGRMASGAAGAGLGAGLGYGIGSNLDAAATAERQNAAIAQLTPSQREAALRMLMIKKSEFPFTTYIKTASLRGSLIGGGIGAGLGAGLGAAVLGEPGMRGPAAHIGAALGVLPGTLLGGALSSGLEADDKHMKGLNEDDRERVEHAVADHRLNRPINWATLLGTGTGGSLGGLAGGYAAHKLSPGDPLATLVGAAAGALGGGTLGYTLGRRRDDIATANWAATGLRGLPHHLRERALWMLADPRL